MAGCRLRVARCFRERLENGDHAARSVHDEVGAIDDRTRALVGRDADGADPDGAGADSADDAEDDSIEDPPRCPAIPTISSATTATLTATIAPDPSQDQRAPRDFGAPAPKPWRSFVPGVGRAGESALDENWKC